ncbi:uncharacterized protein LOC107610812 [Arachis ipaensis]|uniref:uncharacterized protein LOC107610812 n=1 Tax=Arachis ipaensis TaxID=130454 RepID=UPI0007AF6EA6|nr:uncharacterized protein LOC107610812 [Arachis ipaensis]XP_025670078.1 uncharacterized protein LOC112769829 [Arachis hypogaea]
MPIYTLSCFKLPETLIEDVQRAILQFWWGKKRSERRMQWIGWRITCRSKSQRGLNFKDLKAFNLAMLAKQGWRLLTKTNFLIFRVYRSKYFKDSNFLRVEVGINPSWGWRSIVEGRKVLEKGILWRVGTGSDIRIREDSWVRDYLAITLNTETNSEHNPTWVSDLLLPTKSWNQILIQELFRPDIAEAIINTEIQQGDDEVTWLKEKNGCYSVASGY